MIEIIDKKMCTGCKACMLECPTKAISMTKDDEGFEYPVVNLEKCINCDVCDGVCHMLKSKEKEKVDYKYYATALKDKEELKSVSSGGAFGAIAKEIILQKGIVYGAVQEENFIVRHKRAETLEGIKEFRRSKYLESVVGDVFPEVRQDLQEGKKVLFSGTGCQIAALKNFLNKEYNNLLLCEIVCHGVPSYDMFYSYLNEIEKKYNSKLENIIFRDKSYGWLNNQIYMSFNNGKETRINSALHLFHGAYVKGFFHRPCCYSCKYASLPRVGDIVLADFWRYRGKYYKEYREYGISLVVCCTNKSREMLEYIKKSSVYEEVDSKIAMESCRHLTHTPVKHDNYEQFHKYKDKYGYIKAAKKYAIDKWHVRGINFLCKIRDNIKENIKSGEK